LRDRSNRKCVLKPEIFAIVPSSAALIESTTVLSGSACLMFLIAHTVSPSSRLKREDDIYYARFLIIRIERTSFVSVDLLASVDDETGGYTITS
jgi:hypothetical protein